MNMVTPPQAWWSRHITADEPVVDVTLHVKHASEGAIVFGSVPNDMLAGQADVLTRIRVAADEINEAHKKNGYKFEVPIDAEGQWSFPTHWPSKYQSVWIEAVKSLAVLSDEVQVDVKSADRSGPIDLHPSVVGSDFDLYFHNVPPDGQMSVTVSRAEKRRHNAKSSSTRAQTARTTSSSPVRRSLMVTWNPRGSQGTELRRSLEVDPTREKSARIDMGGDQMRGPSSSACTAQHYPAYVLLGFGKLDPNGQTLHESTSTTLLDGQAQSRLSLSPGRWYFECFDVKCNFNVTGVIEVVSSTDTLNIARDAIVVDSTTIPHGIEFTELDGVTLGNLERPIRYTELGPSGKVILNATARYTVLP